MPFVLKLPKNANEKCFLRENNVAQFPEVFCSWSMDWGRILPGSRELWDKQMIWTGGSARYLLWGKNNKPDLPILTVSSAVSQRFWDASLQERTGWPWRKKIEKCDKNQIVEHATVWTWWLIAGITAISWSSSVRNNTAGERLWYTNCTVCD